MIIRRLLIAAVAAVCLALPASASAGSYWWSGTPTSGSNGWYFEQSGGYNPWGGGNRCESGAATIPSGGYCQLVWAVPANLDAVSGALQGSYRHNNANFEQQNFVDGNGMVVLQGTSTVTGYHRQWPDMAGYLFVRLINTGPAQAVSAGTQWFDAPTFTINLVDPHNPGLNILSGHTGWKGTGGACIRYGFGEAGSGLTRTYLQNVTTGAVIDHPDFNNGNVTTGTFQSDRTPCMGAPGTGNYTMRVGATDKSGNDVYNDFTVSFDVTAPNISAPKVGGTEVTNGRQFKGSANQYRPTFTFDYNDGHSGIAAARIYLDGAHVGNGATWTPGSNLSRGNHTVTVEAVDAVGNQAVVTRTFTIVDDVAPTFTVASPTASGGNEPVLDVTAADDHAGVAPATYDVSVNGAGHVASTGTTRLQTSIGRLVDGEHTIVVRVADAAGNVGTRTIAYTADGDPALPQLVNATCPQLTCVHGLDLPTAATEIDENETLHLKAIFAKNGRPVAGTVRLMKGADQIGSAVINNNGVAELDVVINVEGPLSLVAPAGSGLAATPIEYTYVPDTTPPVIAVASPTAAGGSAPVLDVSASDAQSGIDAATWTVTVDGAPFVATSANARLQANLGTLVNGNHSIVVTVKDTKGNQASTTIAYTADSGDGVPPIPAGFLTGVFVYEFPAEVTQGQTYRVKVLLVKDGRPVVGRVEVRKGTNTFAGKDTSPNGAADIAVTLNEAGPIEIHPPTGSGLDPITLDYVFKPATDGRVNCTLTPSAPGCQPGGANTGGGGTNGGNGTNGGTGAPGAADGPALPAGCSATSSKSCPRGVVYYVLVNNQLVPFWNGVPLGESGSKYDKQAPTWKLSVVQRKKGIVRRTRKIQLKLWTSEAGFARVTPVGGKIGSLVSPRRKMRVVTMAVPPKSALGKRLAKAKPGTLVVVKFKITVSDLNNNVSKAKIVTFKVRA